MTNKNSSSIYVITEALKQSNGEFTTTPKIAATSLEQAREELSNIAQSWNTKTNNENGIRTHTPIGQSDDLSIQKLNGSFYDCFLWYSIKETPLAI